MFNNKKEEHIHLTDENMEQEIEKVYQNYNLKRFVFLFSYKILINSLHESSEEKLNILCMYMLVNDVFKNFVFGWLENCKCNKLNRFDFYEISPKLNNELMLMSIGENKFFNYGNLPVVSCSKIKLIEIIEENIKRFNIKLSSEHKNILEKLKKDAAYSSLKSCYNKKNFKRRLDNKNLSINCKKAFDYMENDLFLKDESEIKQIYYENCSKEQYIVMICLFFNQKKICDEYELDHLVWEKVKKLSDERFIVKGDNDCIKFTKNPFVEKLIINPYLRDFVLSDVKIYSDKINDVLQIYVNMCLALTYSEETFIKRPGSKRKKSENNVESLKNISLQNNGVVCYEANMLFAKVLDELNIKYNINYIPKRSIKYGEAHENILFKVDGVVIKADFVKNIFHNDLLLSKTEDNLFGLKLISSVNNILKNQNDLDKVVVELLKKIKVNYDFNYSEISRTQFKDEFENYEKNDSSFLNPLIAFEKIIEHLERLNLNNLESILYIANCIEIFEDKIQNYDKNLKIKCFFCKNIEKQDNQHCELILIVPSFESTNNKYFYKYYVYNKSKGFKRATLEEIRDNFRLKKIKYISTGMHNKHSNYYPLFHVRKKIR